MDSCVVQFCQVEGRNVSGYAKIVVDARVT